MEELIEALTRLTLDHATPSTLPQQSPVAAAARGAAQTSVDPWVCATTLFHDLQLQHGLPKSWTLAQDKALTRAGCTHFSTNTISLSRAYLRTASEQQVRDTLLHEIAHALAGAAAGHGPLWKAQILKIGGIPARCCAPFTEAPLLLRCPCGRNAVPRHRRATKMLTRLCAQCKQPLFYEERVRGVKEREADLLSL